MAAQDNIYFRVTNGPGPFRLIAGDLKTYEPGMLWSDPTAVLDLTIIPMYFGPFGGCPGRELLEHDWELRIWFEAVLKGMTNKFSYPADGPRNLRFLGRFQIPVKLQQGDNPLISDKAAPELAKWQWEVVFNPQSRQGFVSKLPEPLPEEWTM